MCAVTNKRHKTLVIVLGASGRLGKQLLPYLLRDDHTVVGLGRTRPRERLRGIHWQQFDLTNPTYVELSTQALAGMSDVCERAVVLDLTLDKSSVEAMRTSIRAATDFTDLLRKRIGGYRKPVALVVASSTAAAAPWPYQTPYGLAKRRQLRRYAGGPMQCVAYLLPSLQKHPAREPNGPPWLYDAAARHLAAEVDQVCRRRAPMTMVVPESVSEAIDCSTGSVPHDILELRRLLAQRIFGGSNSPQIHRAASRTMLALTPHRLRSYVDHHAAPTRLMYSLARRLTAEIEWIDAEQ